MKKVIITGGSGLIGHRLTAMLIQQRYHVEHLGRKAREGQNIKVWLWNPSQQFIEPGFFDSLEDRSFSIIHLAGEGIMEKKWTAKQKQVIIDSRTRGVDLLLQECIKRRKFPVMFISAGGIGYYGMTTGDIIYDETSLPGNDFLGKCCVLWENAAKKFEPYCSVAVLRTPLVLNHNGGGLPKMMGPVRRGIGSPLGSGKQWVPWVHIQDLCNAYIFVLINNISGVYNVVAPTHYTNAQFMKALAVFSRKPFFMPRVPSGIIRILYGERSRLVTAGSRVNGSALEKKGFHYDFPVVEKALADLFN